MSGVDVAQYREASGPINKWGQDHGKALCMITKNEIGNNRAKN